MIAVDNNPSRLAFSVSTFAHTFLLKSPTVTLIVALTWNDIDLVNNTISVNKTLSHGLDNRLIVDSPKTKESKRTIPLSPTLKQVLLNYRTEPKIISDKIFHTIRGN